jgi:hypothetical protein
MPQVRRPGQKHRTLTAFCRLWFVRMPKPAEDAGTGPLEQEIEGLRMQVQLLNESLAIKRVRLRPRTCRI